MLSFFPRDVLDEILNLIESVSEGLPTYSLLYSNYISDQVHFIYNSKATKSFIDIDLDCIHKLEFGTTTIHCVQVNIQELNKQLAHSYKGLARVIQHQKLKLQIHENARY